MKRLLLTTLIIGITAPVQANDFDPIEFAKKSIKESSSLSRKAMLSKNSGDCESAIFYSSQALKKYSLNILAYLTRADCNNKFKNHEIALKDYDKAIPLLNIQRKKNPKLNDILASSYASRASVRLAILKGEVDDKVFEKVIEDSNNALKYDSNAGIAYFYRGIAKANLSKISNKLDACNDFDLARKLAGQQSDRMVNMAKNRYCK